MFQLLLVAVFATCAVSFPSRSYPVLQYRMISQNMKMGHEILADNPAAQLFDNRVDHFNASNTATYKQRYWVNDKFYKAGGPVFLVVGSYYETDPTFIFNTSLEWANLGQKHNAFLFCLEHRYYGQSMPVPARFSPSDFKYLTTQQTIEDIASFIKGMIGLYPQLNGAKWATMGSSYAGSLSVWSRVAHPDLISIAVASSGPVQAKYDFTELMDGIQYELQQTSQTCASSANAGFKQIAGLTETNSGRAQLKQTFNLCEDINFNDVDGMSYFWSQIYGPYTTIGEYSGLNQGQYRGMLTLKNGICKFHTNTSLSIMDRLKAVNDNYNAAFGNTYCMDIDYEQYLAFYKDPNGGIYSDMGRAWLWQTCTEFGYFQSTDSPTAGFFFGGNNIPVSFYVSQCQAIFGTQITANTVSTGVASTNQRYGGNSVNTPYLLFINGNFDPWRKLSVLSSTGANVQTVVIDQGTHRNDIYTASAADSASLVAARNQVSNILTQWLS